MKEANKVNVPFAAHMNLLSSQSPKTEIEMKEMNNITYANAIGLVMFSMITTRSNLTYAISFLNRFMSNPSKPY